MLQVGDEVITMSAVGAFTIVEIDGDVLTIEDAAGVRKQVLSPNVRKREQKG